MNLCTILASDFDYKLNYLYKDLKPKYDISLFIDVVHLKYESGHVFIFPYGSIVCWFLNNEDCEKILNILDPYKINNPHSVFSALNNKDDKLKDKVYREQYDIEFAKDIRIYEEVIYLNTDNSSFVIDTMLAISHALSQSEKLGIFECEINDLIDEIEPLYLNLAKYGKISLSRKKMSKKIGQLFSVRSFINLHMSILDTPDFFWENEELEPIYKKAIHYLELKPRMEVLNGRMSIIHELYDLLNTELQTMHSHRLEWIIIILILIEVIMSFVH